MELRPNEPPTFKNGVGGRLKISSSDHLAPTNNTDVLSRFSSFIMSERYSFKLCSALDPSLKSVLKRCYMHLPMGKVDVTRDAIIFQKY